MKVLVVEDDILILGLFRRMLEQLNYEVVEASNGKEALNKYNDTFTYVLIDFNLPDMDGRDAAKEFRKKNPNLPILFTTGEIIKDIPLENNEVLLRKPFTLSKLEEKLDKLLNKD